MKKIALVIAVSVLCGCEVHVDQAAAASSERPEGKSGIAKPPFS